MDFYAVLDQVLDLLRQRGRVTYNALKRQFGLDDACLQDLKDEIIAAQRVAVDEGGTVLVWTGAVAASPPPVAAPVSERGRPPDTTPLTYTPPHLAEKILTSRSALEGERKQVTILFADVKDSTELITDLDPEAAQQLLDPALHHMMDAVHRYEGTVNQVLGDGIMAIFGAPLAHEDHAIRACYAALAMQAALREYAETVRRVQGLSLRIRVGLNSGEVVVRTIRNDLHMDYSAVGRETHLAARMEQLAAPGSILLSAATLRLVAGLVRVNVQGPVPVKGLTEPVEIFELVGVTALRRRLQAAAARGLTRFVGRQHELEALRQALERAGMGYGQVVALMGAAGVGKSRLVYECVHAHHTRGWRVLESASVSYGKATPYFPVLDLLKRYCHLEDGDDTRTRRAKVTGQVLTLDDTLQDTIPALLALLDAPPADSPFLSLDPPQRRQRTLDALKRLLLRESQVQPLVLVFEDLHWIDAETQALLNNLVESLPTARLLLLVNYRPEYQHGWGSKTYYTQLRLDPLPAASAEAFLQALLGDDPSLAPLKQLLIARTEGNPFFLEESVRTLVETGVLVGEPGAYVVVKPLDSLQVPATVQAVLAARIDRLPAEEKRLLQTAAVIGTEVSFPLLQAIAELPEAALQRGLATLQAAEFLYETQLFPEQAYTFVHALTHEVAYGSLLQERQRALHGNIVTAIERLYQDRVADQIERLAHHALRGEVWDKAVAYCRQAGVKATERSAYQEAVVYLEQALAALSHLPEGHDIQEQAIDIRLHLRPALFPLGRVQRALDHLREAEASAEHLHDQRWLGQVLASMIPCWYLMGAPERAVEYGERACTIAAALGDVGLQMSSTLSLGQAYVTMGHYRQAADCLSRTIDALHGDLRYQRLGAPAVRAVSSRAWLAWSLAELGEFAEGMAPGAEAIQMAEAARHPYSLIHACYGLGLLHLRRGDLVRAIPVLEQGLDVCQAWGLQTLSFHGVASFLGAAYVLAGRVAEALPLLERVVQQTDAMGVVFDHVLGVIPLGEGYLRAGRIEDALQQAQHAVEVCRQHHQRGHEAWALRLLGEVATRCNPPEVAQATGYYQQALTLADALGMRPLVAHCHHGLGRLYSQTGRGAQARAALPTAIDMYRAMDMTFWLPQAEAALAQVA
jgi:class 3 adenylate cyclase/tetratricopeptide (TPR) repeat protein